MEEGADRYSTRLFQEKKWQEKYAQMTKADAGQEVSVGDETQKTARLPSDEKAELPFLSFPEEEAVITHILIVLTGANHQINNTCCPLLSAAC